MSTYEQWTRDEIERLRADAQRASAEADTLQRTLDKWLASQTAAGAHSDVATRQIAQHDEPKRRVRKATHGSKNEEAIKRIKAASTDGLTMDELYVGFVERFGQEYKRSSLRALLWNQRSAGVIEN